MAYNLGMSDDFLPSEDPKGDAAKTVANIAEHVQIEREGNDQLPNDSNWRALHLIELGPHIDPELGRNYVRVGDQLTKYRKSKISQRNMKVKRLRNFALEQLRKGVPPETVRDELKARQKQVAIFLGTDDKQMTAEFTRFFSKADLLYGCLEGGSPTVISPDLVVFNYDEALPCEGGITNRYYLAMSYES